MHAKQGRGSQLTIGLPQTPRGEGEGDEILLKEVDQLLDFSNAPISLLEIYMKEMTYWKEKALGLKKCCEELMQRIRSAGDQGTVAVVHSSNDSIVTQVTSFEGQVGDEAVLENGHVDVAPVDGVVGVQLNQDVQGCKELVDCVDKCTRKVKIDANWTKALQNILASNEDYNRPLINPTQTMYETDPNYRAPTCTPAPSAAEVLPIAELSPLPAPIDVPPPYRRPYPPPRPVAPMNWENRKPYGLAELRAMQLEDLYKVRNLVESGINYEDELKKWNEAVMAEVKKAVAHEDLRSLLKKQRGDYRTVL